MSFQIKDFPSITAGQINHARSATRKITDYQPGSVARTLMEAPAVEIEQLYLQMFDGLREAIPVAAYEAFGFGKLPATRARGIARIVAASALLEDRLIEAGAVFTALDGREYRSVTDVVWVEGQSAIEVLIEYPQAGVSGNLAANQLAAVAGMDDVAVGNDPIISGRDTETGVEREARFADYVRSLSQGTLIACRNAARNATVRAASGEITEFVTRVGLTEQPGRVTIYLYSSNGVPSLALLDNAQRRLDGWRDDATGQAVPGVRSGGVRTDAVSMTERRIGGMVTVSLLSGTFSPDDQVRALANISAVMRGIQPGQVLYTGAIEEAVRQVGTVRGVVLQGFENTLCAQGEVLLPGDIAFLTASGSV